MIGQVLGDRYELHDQLGSGGMATVWRATDRSLGREVAVKVLREPYADDPAFIARFEREARHAAGLSHPGLVTVFDVGDGVAPYIVMELVHGRTLKQVLDEDGKLPVDEAIAIAAQMCQALEVAHAAGLVHRDIKPANVMLTSGGQVKVLDFGIARASGADKLTATATVLGTGAYLAPEQASGQEAGPQADLYALGCVLYEMVTGATPFQAESPVALAYQHVHDEPLPPSRLQPELPPAIDALILRLLAKDPRLRPAGAALARSELLAAVSPDATLALGSRVPAAPTDPIDATRVMPSGRSDRNSRLLWVSLVAIGVVLVVVLLLLLLLSGGGTPPRHAAHTGKPTPSSHHPKRSTRTTPSHTAQPGVGTAIANTIKDINSGVQSGEIDQPAAQDLINHLSPLVANSADQTSEQITAALQAVQQALANDIQHGQVRGDSATVLQQDLQTLATAEGVTLSTATAGPPKPGHGPPDHTPPGQAKKHGPGD